MGGLAFTPDMVWKALRMSAQDLRRDENELIYLNERLTAIENIAINNDTWRDYMRAWESLLDLRSGIMVERGQSILHSIVSDIALVDGLGAAFQMRKIDGNPPNEVLVLLNEGPGEHVHKYAFKYRQLIERELFGIRRVRTFKIGAMGLLSGALVASMIGFFDNLWSVAFFKIMEWLEADEASTSSFNGTTTSFNGTK